MHTKVAATTTAMVTASPSPSTIIGGMNDDDEDMKLSCKNGAHSDQYQAIEPRDKTE